MKKTTKMYCKIIKISNNFYSLSVWDLEDNMMFWNTSPNRDYLMKFAKKNYGFCRHEVIGYQEMIEEERQNEDESKLKGTV